MEKKGRHFGRTKSLIIFTQGFFFIMEVKAFSCLQNAESRFTSLKSKSIGTRSQEIAS